MSMDINMNNETQIDASAKLKQRQANDPIAFKNTDIFGKGFSRMSKSDEGALAKLLAAGVLSLDGYIDTSEPDKLDTKLMWFYLRYIWVHNKSNPDFDNEFKWMEQVTPTGILKGAALARGFVAKVLNVNDPMTIQLYDAESITPEQIARTINDIISRHIGAIELPFLKQILKLVFERLGQDSATNISYIQGIDQHQPETQTVPVRVNIYNTNANTIVQQSTQELPINVKDGRLSVTLKI